MAVTMRTIAEKAGVSVPAVSWVLNNRDVEMRISPERSAQIRRIAKELNYVPSAAARSIVSNKTRQIGVLVKVSGEGISAHPRAMETMMGINAGLEPSGNIVVVIPVTGNVASDRVESRIFRERLLDGLIMLETVPEEDEKRATSLVPAAVWVNGNVWKPECCIRRDEFAAGKTVASEMLKLGYRKIIFVDKIHDGHYSIDERRNGVQAAIKDAGSKVELEVVTPPHLFTPFPPELLKLTPETALIACDFYAARLLQGTFCETGQRPGTDFGFACCDDADELSWTWPNLARVEFNRFDMGYRAANMLLQRLAGGGEKVASELLSAPWIPGSTAKKI